MSFTAPDFEAFALMCEEIATRFRMAGDRARETDGRGTNAAHVAALDLLETLNRAAGQREPPSPDAHPVWPYVEPYTEGISREEVAMRSYSAAVTASQMLDRLGR